MTSRVFLLGVRVESRTGLTIRLQSLIWLFCTFLHDCPRHFNWPFQQWYSAAALIMQFNAESSWSSTFNIDHFSSLKPTSGLGHVQSMSLSLIVWQRFCEPARLRIAYCLSVCACLFCPTTHTESANAAANLLLWREPESVAITHLASSLLM